MNGKVFYSGVICDEVVITGPGITLDRAEKRDDMNMLNATDAMMQNDNSSIKPFHLACYYDDVLIFRLKPDTDVETLQRAIDEALSIEIQVISGAEYAMAVIRLPHPFTLLKRDSRADWPPDELRQLLREQQQCERKEIKRRRALKRTHAGQPKYDDQQPDGYLLVPLVGRIVD